MCRPSESLTHTDSSEQLYEGKTVAHEVHRVIKHLARGHTAAEPGLKLGRLALEMKSFGGIK